MNVPVTDTELMLYFLKNIPILKLKLGHYNYIKCLGTTGMRLCTIALVVWFACWSAQASSDEYNNKLTLLSFYA